MTPYDPDPRYVEPDPEPEWRVSWTWRFWKRVHGLVNRLAWHYAKPPGPVFGSALRIDRTHPLWRLNDALGARWSNDWVARTVARSRHELSAVPHPDITVIRDAPHWPRLTLALLCLLVAAVVAWLVLR